MPRAKAGGTHYVISPVWSEERKVWYVECSCGWEGASRYKADAWDARIVHLNEPMPVAERPE